MRTLYPLHRDLYPPLHPVAAFLLFCIDFLIHWRPQHPQTSILLCRFIDATFLFTSVLMFIIQSMTIFFHIAFLYWGVYV